MKTLLLLISLTSCTNQYVAKKIDTKLEVKDSYGDSKIGLNEEREVIIQTETNAADELRTQQWANAKLQDDLQSSYLDLKQCREDLSDPRLGGNGEIAPLPEIDNLKQVSELREKFGLTENGSLKVVKKEYFLERLEVERKYEVTLKSTIKLVATTKESCERKMTTARLKNGLPGKRIEAKGYFTSDGTWVASQRAERNIDDAFEMSAGK